MLPQALAPRGVRPCPAYARCAQGCACLEGFGALHLKTRDLLFDECRRAHTPTAAICRAEVRRSKMRVSTSVLSGGVRTATTVPASTRRAHMRSCRRLVDTPRRCSQISDKVHCAHSAVALQRTSWRGLLVSVLVFSWHDDWRHAFRWPFSGHELFEAWGESHPP